MADLSDGEPCIQGFLLSCDQNSKKGIEKHEWDSCFPKTAGNSLALPPPPGKYNGTLLIRLSTVVVELGERSVGPGLATQRAIKFHLVVLTGLRQIKIQAPL